MREKNLWRSDIIGKVAGLLPATLLKVSLLQKSFSCILLKSINAQVIPSLDYWSQVGLN